VKLGREVEHFLVFETTEVCRKILCFDSKEFVLFVLKVYWVKFGNVGGFAGVLLDGIMRNIVVNSHAVHF
jgi:hypothetical protein